MFEMSVWKKEFRNQKIKIRRRKKTHKSEYFKMKLILFCFFSALYLSELIFKEIIFLISGNESKEIIFLIVQIFLIEFQIPLNFGLDI